MDLQTIKGISKSLGAVASGGSVSVRPATLPQTIDGTLINAVKATATIDAVTGAFEIPVAKGATVVIRGADGRGKEFLQKTITVSSDDELNLSAYLEENPPAVPVATLVLYGGGP